MGDDDSGDQDAADLDGPLGVIETDPHLAAAFAAVDVAISKADRALAGETNRRPDRDPLVYDPDWDEDARLGDWRAVVEQTRTLPPLAAAIAADAWDRIEPLQHTPWLGRLLAAALLRGRGKTRTHLACLHVGLKTIPRERRDRPQGPWSLAHCPHPARPQAQRPPLHLPVAGIA